MASKYQGVKLINIGVVTMAYMLVYCYIYFMSTCLWVLDT